MRIATAAIVFMTLMGSRCAMAQAPPAPDEPIGALPPEAPFESQQQFSDRLDQVVRENELLSKRLMELESRRPAGSNPSAGSSNEFDDQPPDIRTDQRPSGTSSSETNSLFMEGFKWRTEDGEFSLNLHAEIQADIRAYAQRTDPVDQFGYDIHRMRFIFNGHLSKPIEYNLSISQGLGDLQLLDAYLNFDYDSRLQFRFGRYRVPFGYDSYALSNQFLLTPERSVFAINYGYNRNMAAMWHGELLESSVEYALAVANGPRNSIYDQNAAKDLLTYVNVRPFLSWECELPALKYLNIGASSGNGIQDQSPQPKIFRTSTNATNSEGAATMIPAFLQLNSGVTEEGLRSQWEVHMAWYYKQLSVQAAYDWGFNTYYNPANSQSVRLPVEAYHVQFGYFLTGEQVERRTFVSPLQPFDLRAGRRGPGAIELQARFDHFAVGNEVFTGGLADPALWTNRTNTIDAGVNWYLNKYVKIMFDWQHSMYASPVIYRPGGYSRSLDLFWTRMQVYF